MGGIPPRPSIPPEPRTRASSVRDKLRGGGQFRSKKVRAFSNNGRQRGIVRLASHVEPTVTDCNLYAKEKLALKTEYDKVFAIGDVIAVTIAPGKSRLKAGVLAHYEAELMAENSERPTRIWHWGKILFEKYWLWKWF